MITNQAFSWNNSSDFDRLEGSVIYYYEKQANIFYGI
jgi:hypothetical protein